MFDKQKNSKGEPLATDSSSSVATTAPRASSTISASGLAAVIGKSIVINGDVSGDEDLIVEGKIEGSVNLHAHELKVGQAGVVNADINAKAVRIDGEVQGDIVGNDVVTIAKSGNVRGNIVAPRVTLEDGAKFKGSIDMDPGESNSSKKPKGPVAQEVADSSSVGAGVTANAKNG